ncbi:MAG: carbohydrate ABC transporter permease [Clostridiales bacterium]|nr:carbohydrate ABC transporter permease [Clostridiales bacterium]
MSAKAVKFNKGTKIKKSTGEIIFDIFNYTFLGIITLICLYPLLHVLFCSFSDPITLMKHSGIMFGPLLPATTMGYQLTFQNSNILIGYKNTIFYVVVGTVLNVFFTGIAGYVLSRKDYIWRNVIMAMITFTMFFGGGMIPTYLVVKNLGLYDSRWALIIPGLVTTYNMIICRTAMAGLPDGLIESAKLDGANDFTIFIKIAMPLTKATMAVLTLYYAVGHWNAWFNALIYLRSNDKWPLQMFLRQILIMNNMTEMTDANMQATGDADIVFMARELVQYAVIIVATAPILCVYPFIQKYFVKGVMIGSIKG